MPRFLLQNSLKTRCSHNFFPKLLQNLSIRWLLPPNLIYSDNSLLTMQTLLSPNLIPMFLPQKIFTLKTRNYQNFFPKLLQNISLRCLVPPNLIYSGNSLLTMKTRFSLNLIPMLLLQKTNTLKTRLSPNLFTKLLQNLRFWRLVSP